MIYTRLRSGLIVLFIGLGLLLHVQTGLGNAWYLYAAALVLIISHMLFGNVWLAFGLLRKGKMEQAEKLLATIKRPELLVKRNRAYYHFSKGLIYLQKKELKVGEQHLRQAMKLGLQRKNDQALATLNLAHIFYVQKSFVEAASFLEQARSFEPTDLMIKDNIEKLDQALGSILN